MIRLLTIKAKTLGKGKYHPLHFLEVCLSHFPSLLMASFQAQTGSSNSPVTPKQVRSTHPLTDFKGKSQMVTTTERSSSTISHLSLVDKLGTKMGQKGECVDEGM